ncbi:MAG: 5'/3'-nucleotidase SurE [Halanaeroarchaeum sp.]
MDAPSILLTNDDGIDSPGIRVLAEELSTVGDVTVVAPADNKSAVGRATSSEARVQDHDLGYALEGTPVDCVVAGIEALGPAPDVVVAGVNRGANLGMYVLGRSGTVSAAVEAAFFGVPAIATSLYLPDERWKRDPRPAEYAEAARATRYLVEEGLDTDVFETADYLNVNAPAPENGHPEMRVTSPSTVYDMTATKNGETVSLEDNIWQQMERDSFSDREGTDRRAILDGVISVSPLTAPHTTERHAGLDDLADGYGGNR